MLPPRSLTVCCLQLLAFYTEMHSAELESFDVTEADAKMQYIMSELRFLFQNLVV